MGDMISKAINSFLEGIIKGALKWIINILTGTVKLLNTNMNEIAVYYGIFLGFATSLVLVVVLARIIVTIMKEADDSTDATWANIIMDAVKSAISIPLMVFIQGFLIRAFTIPLVTYIFKDAGGLSEDTVNHAVKVATGNGTGYGYGVPLLILGFFLVVLVVFFVKIGIFFADLAFFNISIPIVAVSVATESFEYASTWWKKLLYLNLTLIAQTMAMALMVASFGLLDKGWGYLAFTIGFGVLVIKAPTILQDMWQSTGLGKATATGGMRAMAMMLRSR